MNWWLSSFYRLPRNISDKTGAKLWKAAVSGQNYQKG
jgi:hypothetical protein